MHTSSKVLIMVSLNIQSFSVEGFLWFLTFRVFVLSDTEFVSLQAEPDPGICLQVVYLESNLRESEWGCGKTKSVGMKTDRRVISAVERWVWFGEASGESIHPRISAQRKGSWGSISIGSYLVLVESCFWGINESGLLGYTFAEVSLTPTLQKSLSSKAESGKPGLGFVIIWVWAHVGLSSTVCELRSGLKECAVRHRVHLLQAEILTFQMLPNSVSSFWPLVLPNRQFRKAFHLSDMWPHQILNCLSSNTVGSCKRDTISGWISPVLNNEPLSFLSPLEWVGVWKLSFASPPATKELLISS